MGIWWQDRRLGFSRGPGDVLGTVNICSWRSDQLSWMLWLDRMPSEDGSECFMKSSMSQVCCWRWYW